MAEEFQESEVIFSDYRNNDDGNHSDSYLSYQEMVSSNNNSGRVGRFTINNDSKKKNKSSEVHSVPVNINIPDNIFQYGDRCDHQFEEGYEDGEIVPPHVIIGRRIAGKMAFSVCTGIGRTLKGRDLSQVRNSILRMTGFLET